MRNLYEETMEYLEGCGYTECDIKAVFGDDYQIPIENFLEVAKKTNYNQGYGAPEVADDLIILMKDGAYLKRRDYDGSEWWELQGRVPVLPEETRTVKYLSVHDGLIGWESLASLNKDLHEE